MCVWGGMSEPQLKSGAKTGSSINFPEERCWQPHHHSLPISPTDHVPLLAASTRGRAHVRPRQSSQQKAAAAKIEADARAAHRCGRKRGPDNGVYGHHLTLLPTRRILPHPQKKGRVPPPGVKGVGCTVRGLTSAQSPVPSPALLAIPMR